MKPAHIVLAISAVVIATFAAVSADSSSAAIPLRYVAASELYDSVKQQLGPAAASAVVAVDIRANALQLDASHPDAAKVRELIAKLDHRPATMIVKATVKRMIPATPTTEASEQILARPMLFGRPDRPITLSFDDGALGTINVDLEVTLNPEQAK